MTTLATLGAAAISLCLFVWFVKLERAGRPATVLYTVIGLIVFESAFYPDPFEVPGGIFHPGSGSLSFRLQDLVIPAALAARLIVRGGPRRLDAVSGWWIAFLAWLTTAAVVGADLGNPVSQVTFEGKAILYIGLFALASGVSVEELLGGGRLERLIRWSAGYAALLDAMHLSHVVITKSFPLVPLDQFGLVGSDAATVFGTLGVIAVAMGLTSEAGRIPLLVAAVPLLVSAAVSKQRAAMLGVVVALGVFSLAALVWRRRIRATPTELGLTVLGMAAVLLVPFVIASALGTAKPSVPLASSVRTALTDQSKKLSAASRVSQFDAVRHVIAQRPWFGWGLGKEYDFFDPGFKTWLRTPLSHDITTDLLLRTGVVGLLFFFASVIVTAIVGLDVWRREQNDAVAAFALAATACLLGLVAKGFVESIFEKYRLAALMGLLVGFVLAAAARLRVPAAATAPALRPAFGFAGGAAGVARPGSGVLAASGDRERRPAGGGHEQRHGDDGLQRRRNALIVQEQRLAERERALAERRTELEWLRSEIERMQVAHDEREQRLAELEGRIDQRLAALERRLAGPLDAERARVADDALAERETRLAQLHEVLERRTSELSVRDRDLAERERRLDALHDTLEQRAAELAAMSAEVAASPPAAPLSPAAVPVAGPAIASAEAPVAPRPSGGAVGSWNLVELERLVAAHGGAEPEDVDEWRSYLLVLRDHAAADGSLPPNFDALVWEVFGDLVDR